MSSRRLLALLVSSTGFVPGLGCSASSGTGGASGTGGMAVLPTQTGGAGGAPAPAAAGSAGFMNPPAGAGGSTGPISPIGTGGVIAPIGSGGSPPLATGGSAGAPGTGGAGGMPMPMGTTMPPNPSSCPAPPADTSANAVSAWTTVNQVRLAAGAGCMNSVATLVASATAHCNYVAANVGNAMCNPDAHTEVSGCTGFTGADAQTREYKAGYPRTMAYTEVLTTFGNNPTLAVPNWIDTVWHRIPLLDPWTTDMGYGGAARCDVIDIGRGMSTMPASTVVAYPYDGQTNVPPSFSGLEGPAPPAPPSGWPSSYPINIYAQRISVTEHVLTKDGDPTPLDHLWLDAKAPEVSAGLKGYFTDTAFLYGAPFETNTKYRVKIVGTYAGGMLDKEWTFTTGAKRPFGQ